MYILEERLRLGLDDARIAVLVVAPQTDPEHAQATMMAGAGVDDASTVDGSWWSARPGNARIRLNQIFLGYARIGARLLAWVYRITLIQ